MAKRAKEAPPVEETPPALEPAQAAFVRGDWRAAQDLAREVGGDDGKRMLSRFRPDPVVLAIVVCALALFFYCIVHYGVV